MIGTVNAAEFFLTVTISATFIAALGWEAFTEATVGLLIGGIAGGAARRLCWPSACRPARLMIMVGVVLTLTSAYGIWRAFG